MTNATRRGRRTAALTLLLLVSSGCGHGTNEATLADKSSAGEVVIYASIDEPDLAPLMKEFEKRTGITVRTVTDTEATKTSVLAERLEAEKDHPRADVYWSNEICHPIRLAQLGMFDRYRPATAEDVPAKWRDHDDRYTCVGIRARVIGFSTRPECASLVKSLHGLADLENPAFKGRIAMCHPAYGTASDHVAALYVRWGEPKFIAFMKAMRANDMQLVGGNSVVADEIGSGRLWVGTTDNDDVDEGKENHQAIDGMFPDQEADGAGTLLIPGAVALVHGAPHPETARKLLDFLCTPAVEKELIDGQYLAWSVRAVPPVKAMDVDYAECSRQMRHAIEIALGILQDRN